GEIAAKLVLIDYSQPPGGRPAKIGVGHGRRSAADHCEIIMLDHACPLRRIPRGHDRCGGSPRGRRRRAYAALRLKLASAIWVSFLSADFSSSSVFLSRATESDSPSCSAQAISVP